MLLTADCFDLRSGKKDVQSSTTSQNGCHSGGQTCRVAAEIEAEIQALQLAHFARI